MRLLHPSWLLLALCCAATCSGSSSSSSLDEPQLQSTERRRIARAPLNISVKPLRYRVSLHTDPRRSPNYHGYVKILLKTVKNCSLFELDMDSRTLAIGRVRIKATGPDGSREQACAFRCRVISNMTVSQTKLTVRLKEELKAGTLATVTVRFTGKMQESGHGLIRCRDPDAGEDGAGDGGRGWQVHTAFAPTGARTAFPCFDRPDLRAVFSLQISLPTTLSAYASAPIESQQVLNEHVQVIKFARTAKLPISAVGWALGQFVKMQETVERFPGLEIAMVSPHNCLPFTDYILNTSKHYIGYLNELLDTAISVKHILYVSAPPSMDCAAATASASGIVTIPSTVFRVQEENVDTVTQILSSSSSTIFTSCSTSLSSSPSPSSSASDSLEDPFSVTTLPSRSLLPLFFAAGTAEAAFPATAAGAHPGRPASHPTSIRGKQQLSSLIARKTAQHWFGHCLAPASPDDRALTEGLSIWSALKALEWTHVEWNIMAEHAATDRDQSLLLHSHSLSPSPAIQEADWVKASAVVRMIECAAGPTVLSQALKHLLQTQCHEGVGWGEFADAVEHFAKLPSGAIAEKIGMWVSQLRFPLITITESDDGSWTLQQSVFKKEWANSSGLEDDCLIADDILFAIPLVAVSDSFGEAWWDGKHSITIERPKDHLLLFRDPLSVYCRIRYPASFYSALTEIDIADRMRPQERAVFLSDLCALAMSGHLPTRVLLEGLSKFASVAEHAVWVLIDRCLSRLAGIYISNHLPRSPHLRSFISNSIVGPQLEKLGMAEQADDSDQTRLTRSLLIRWSSITDDPVVLKDCAQRMSTWLCSATLLSGADVGGWLKEHSAPILKAIANSSLDYVLLPVDTRGVVLAAAMRHSGTLMHAAALWRILAASSSAHSHEAKGRDHKEALVAGLAALGSQLVNWSVLREASGERAPHLVDILLRECPWNWLQLFEHYFGVADSGPLAARKRLGALRELIEEGRSSTLGFPFRALLLVILKTGQRAYLERIAEVMKAMYGETDGEREEARMLLSIVDDNISWFEENPTIDAEPESKNH